MEDGQGCGEAATARPCVWPGGLAKEWGQANRKGLVCTSHRVSLWLSNLRVTLDPALGMAFAENLRRKTNLL
jgi:hypothetical protein